LTKWQLLSNGEKVLLSLKRQPRSQRQRGIFWVDLAVLVLPLCVIVASAAQGPLAANLAQMAISVTTIQKGNFSGIREPLQIVVRAQDEWEKLWKRHTAIQSPPSLPPAVNFATEMVIGLFAGEKTTGGYDSEITSVEIKDGRLEVFYTEKAPPPGGIGIQALTQPFHLIKLPRSDIPVVFIRLHT
jgi:hypothetical protein